MAASLKAFIALMAIATFVEVAMCENYTVGGPTSTWSVGPNYEEWVKDKKFFTGDFIIFKYTSAHDVAEVTKDDYDSCSSTNELSIDKSGNTVFELKKAGTRYFICTVPSHCSNGMKVEIKVLTKSSTPPAPAPGKAPAPAKSKTPTPAPAPAPAPPAPSPSGNNAAQQHGVGFFAYSVLGLMLAVL